MIYVKVIEKPRGFGPEVNYVFTQPALFGRGHWKSTPEHAKSCNGKNSGDVEFLNEFWENMKWQLSREWAPLLWQRRAEAVRVSFAFSIRPVKRKSLDSAYIKVY